MLADSAGSMSGVFELFRGGPLQLGRKAPASSAWADFQRPVLLLREVELAQPVVVAGPQVGLAGADGVPFGGAAIGVGANPFGERPPLGVPGGQVAVRDPGRRAGDFAQVSATVWGVAEGPVRACRLIE